MRLFVLLLLVTTFIGCSDDDSPLTPQEITFTDTDGNVYETITIGNQIWAAENLKTTKYNDGTPITEWVFGMDWAALGSANNGEGFYQWAETSDLNNVIDEELPFDYYGAMYNYFAIESGKLAPEGWRIPTEQDFRELETFLANNGAGNNVAAALKSETGWITSSSNGTNTFGFNALPNGYVAGGGTATAPEIIASWITADVADGTLNSSLTRRWVQLFDEPGILYSDTSIILGAGIRLIKE